MGEMTEQEKIDFYRRFNMLEEQIKKLNDQNTRILSILESDHKIKEKGLVEKVSDMQKELDGLLKRENSFRSKLAVYGFFAGGFVTVLVWVLQFLANKYYG